MIAIAVVLTLISGIISGLGHALQRRSTDVLPELTPRTFIQRHIYLLVAIFTTPLWLFGGVLAVSGALFRWQAFALADISILKPLVNVNLLVVVIICVGLWGERIGQTEWIGLIALLSGILVLSFSAEERVVVSYSVLWYAVSAILCLVFVGLFILFGSRKGRSPLEKELLFALSAGTLYGIATIFLKAMTIEVLQVLGYFQILDLRVLLVIVTRGSFWLYGVSSVIAYFLIQCAYSRRRASVALPLNNSLSTIIPIIVAIPVFGETLFPPVDGYLVFPYSYLRIIGIIAVLGGIILLRSFQGKFLTQGQTNSFGEGYGLIQQFEGKY